MPIYSDSSPTLPAENHPPEPVIGCASTIATAIWCCYLKKRLNKKLNRSSNGLNDWRIGCGHWEKIQRRCSDRSHERCLDGVFVCERLKTKKALFVGTLMIIAAVVIPSQGIASTTGHKRVGCSYKNPAHPSKNISGTCNVDYGVVGVSGSAFRRVHWSDGIITQISIGKAGVTIDGNPAASVKPSVACKLEAYRINGNVIELRGDLCR